ncbi:MAG: hypothetical protein WC100_03550 [Sterolibacterium sp.]
MAQLETPGKFKAVIIENAVSESKPKEGKPSEGLQWAAKYFIQQYFDEATKQWMDCADQNLVIQGWQAIIKNDGEASDFGINTLKEVLGWDGVDLTYLDGDLSAIVVQITTAFEADQKGVSRLKVKWLNPENFEGNSLTKLDPAALKSLNAKIGSKLRALSPPAPAAAKTTTPAQPAAAGAAPASKPLGNPTARKF